MTARDWLAALAAAWEMLIDRPKFSGVAAGRIAAVERENPRLVLWCFPLLGLVLGVVPAVLCGLLHAVMPPVGGAVLFALAVFLMLEMKDSGASLALSASLVEQKVRGQTWRGAFARLSPLWSSLGTPAATLTVLAMAAVKLTALALIYRCGSYWFPAAVLVLNFTVQGALASERSIIDASPMLAVRRDRKQEVWYVAALALAVLFFLKPWAWELLVAGLASYALCRGFRRRCLANFSGVDANLVTLAGGWAETLALLAALLLLV